MRLQNGYLTVDEEKEKSKAACLCAPIAAIRPALPGPLFTWGESWYGRLGHNHDALPPVPCTINAFNMQLQLDI
jgi:hypothetical protein